jgi:hypothetical protein
LDRDIGVEYVEHALTQRGVVPVGRGVTLEPEVGCDGQVVVAGGVEPWADARLRRGD